MRKIIVFALIVLIQLFSIPNSGVNGDSFTGVEDLITDTFSSVKYTKIDWSTVPTDEFDEFSVIIYKDGDVDETDSFDGSSGTTYLYESGTFYFDVLVFSLDSWSITTSPTNGEYIQDLQTITGLGFSNSKLFECHGSCVLSWSTTGTEEFFIFTTIVYEIGGAIPVGSLSGLTGTTTLTKDGTFYFAVYAANLDSWSITLDLDESSGGSSTSSSQSGSNSQSGSSTTSNTNLVSSTNPQNNSTGKGSNSSDEASASTLGFWFSFVILTYFSYRSRKYNKAI